MKAIVLRLVRLFVKPKPGLAPMAPFYHEYLAAKDARGAIERDRLAGKLDDRSRRRGFWI